MGWQDRWSLGLATNLPVAFLRSLRAERERMSDVTFGVFMPQGWKMELGYDSIWLYDHFHNVPVPAHEAVFECWATMAAISQRTSRVRLG